MATTAQILFVQGMGAGTHDEWDNRLVTAPPSHADLYADVIPQARVYRLPGRDHQLNDDLGDVAAVIRLGDAAGTPSR
ncbi:hypothetical protein ACLQ26_06825 [Micromonospora sp. DT43]|uniref:hypothetical protein n=1 Tax=Micromonospora sp. DT43 TaxID=3393440 RepID=UPI003CF535F3